MKEAAMTIGIVAAFLVIFPLFWMGIVLLVSRVSGCGRPFSSYSGCAHRHSFNRWVSSETDLCFRRWS